MTKSLLVLLVALVFCASALHMQKYAPSTPGGTYYNPPNGTSTYSQGTSGGTITAYINGNPYTYTGPFTLVCYYQNSNQVFRYDSCYDAYNCADMLKAYSNCLGAVKRYMI